MNYALIGCGRIAGNHITAALENHLHITAVCDIVEEKALDIVDRFGLDEDFGTKCYTDYKKLIDENTLDLVAVATDSGTHGLPRFLIRPTASLNPSIKSDISPTPFSSCGYPS